MVGEGLQGPVAHRGDAAASQGVRGKAVGRLEAEDGLVLPHVSRKHVGNCMDKMAEVAR